jgi:hypothetical protein
MTAKWGQVAGAEEPRLASELERSAHFCEDALEAYADAVPQIGATPFANELRLAVASMRTLRDRLGAAPIVRETALHITLTLCRDAASAARGYGFDEATLRVAMTLDGVVLMCESALDATF